MGPQRYPVEDLRKPALERRATRQVRAVGNAIERAVVLGSPEFILAEDLSKTFLEDLTLGTLSEAQDEQPSHSAALSQNWPADQ